MPGTESVVPNSAPSTAASAPGQAGGRRHKGASVKTLKRVLKKAGLKTTGRKAALTRRAKKAHLMRGGDVKPAGEVDVAAAKVVEESESATGGRRRSRKSKGFRLY